MKFFPVAQIVSNRARMRCSWVLIQYHKRKRKPFLMLRCCAIEDVVVDSNGDNFASCAMVMKIAPFVQRMNSLEYLYDVFTRTVSWTVRARTHPNEISITQRCDSLPSGTDSTIFLPSLRRRGKMLHIVWRAYRDKKRINQP